MGVRASSLASGVCERSGVMVRYIPYMIVVDTYTDRNCIFSILHTYSDTYRDMDRLST